MYVVWNNLIWGIHWSVSCMWLWKFSYYPFTLHWLLWFRGGYLIVFWRHSLLIVWRISAHLFLPPFSFWFSVLFFFFLGGAGYMGLRAVSGCQTRCGWCHLSNFLAFHVHSLLPFPIFHLCFSPLLSNFLFLGCLEVLRIIVWLAKWHKQQGKETLILAGDSTMYFC